MSIPFKLCALAVAALALPFALAGCSSTSTDGALFDYAMPTAETGSEPVSAAAKAPTGALEKPGTHTAADLLGPFQNGPGYKVADEVDSDGKYFVYHFDTDYGDYDIVSTALAEKHIHELFAMNELESWSKSERFMDSFGDAVASPVLAIYNTTAHPVGATKAVSANVSKQVASAGRTFSRAGEYITTMGHPEKTRPKREIASTLMVDPYTHFQPLADELDEIASYSAAGSFGVDRAVGFVGGPAGTIISSVKRLDSLTEQSADMSPGDIAVANKKALLDLGVSQETIKALLLNDKLTPTEKRLAVGCLVSLKGMSGVEQLASFMATSTSRHDALEAFYTAIYFSTKPFDKDKVVSIDIVDRVPVVTTGDSKIAVMPADELYWTAANKAQIEKINATLDAAATTGGQKREIWVSGTVSPDARRELARRQWSIREKVFS